MHVFLVEDCIVKLEEVEAEDPYALPSDHLQEAGTVVVRLNITLPRNVVVMIINREVKRRQILMFNTTTSRTSWHEVIVTVNAVVLQQIHQAISVVTWHGKVCRSTVHYDCSVILRHFKRLISVVELREV